MQIGQMNTCREYAFSGLQTSLRTFVKMSKDRSGTANLAYAFLAALIAVAATTAFTTTGTAVGSLYDSIAVVFVASMPSVP